MRVLVLNAGSSSLKIRVEQVAAAMPSVPPPPLWKADLKWGAHDDFEAVLRGIPELGRIQAAGHRIVHGGERFRQSTLITPEVRESIGRLAEFAPEHNRIELAGIDAVERVLGPEIPQIAVFDTAFHATLEPRAYVYPGPYDWIERGIRRFGFHGISNQYVSRRAAEILGRGLASLRLVVCHLGNGCSVTAIREGRSIDTTMGFTPLDGVMMGSRSGSVDPGILIALVRDDGYSADRLDHLLNEQAGLQGLSGVSSDMREVLAAMAAGNERARLAFEVYCHRIVRESGAMIASVGGVDALVFTAGVGENCAPLRELVCRQLEFLGLRLNAAANASSPIDADIAEAGSTVRVLVVHTEEDWEIARECRRVLGGPE